jgi:uncharacterized membrane protein
LKTNQPKADHIVARIRRETSIRFGGDPRQIAGAIVFGAGLGGLLHRLLVWSFGRWDRLAVVDGAPGASVRDGLLSFTPWALMVAGLAALASTDGGRRSRWGLRRAVGVALASAGAVVLVVGELEVHVFRTLVQGWAAHNLTWDVIFHVPGEAIAFVGWLLLPMGRTRTRATV